MPLLILKHAVKNFNLESKKCKKLHVGKTKSKIRCQNLKIGEWKVKNVRNTNTSENSHEEIFTGDTDITETDDERYLGDIISKNGKNAKNIAARIKKSIGTCRKIINSLHDI